MRHLSFVLFLAACSSDIPAEPAGDRIEGTVVYDGQAAQAMTRPAFQVMAFYDFPTALPPHSLVVIEAPDPSMSTPFDVQNLAPYAYKVYAQLIDLDQPNADTSMNPGGGYPNFCALFADAGKVTVTDDTAATGIDITLYDYGGGLDPCMQ